MTRADDLRKSVNKTMGGNVLQMGSDKRYQVSYMPTGLLPFDILLNGGIPRGRFVTVTGAYSTLKSYLGLQAIAETQRRNGVCALIDTEHAFDPSWAEALGVDVKNLIVWPPLSDGDEPPQDVTGEEALDMAEVLIRGQADLIVFDSVAAALPQQEQNKRLSKESVQPGRQAALMSLAMRKLTAPNRRTGVLWINQLREQIGVTFGNPEKATGGRALPYYSSLIVNIRTAGFITEEVKVFTGDKNASTKRKVGQTFVGQVQKSKLSTPWTDLYFDYSMVKGGIDMPKFLFARGVEMGVFTKKGNAWAYGSVSGASKDKFISSLAADPEVMQELEDEVRRFHGLTPLGPPKGPGRTRAAVSKRSYYANEEPAPIPARGRAASGSTAAPKKKLSR